MATAPGLEPTGHEPAGLEPADHGPAGHGPAGHEPAGHRLPAYHRLDRRDVTKPSARPEREDVSD